MSTFKLTDMTQIFEEDGALLPLAFGDKFDKLNDLISPSFSDNSISIIEKKFYSIPSPILRVDVGYTRPMGKFDKFNLETLPLNGEYVFSVIIWKSDTVRFHGEDVTGSYEMFRYAPYRVEFKGMGSLLFRFGYIESVQANIDKFRFKGE